MNSNKEKDVDQSTADKNEIASYQNQIINKEKCERSQELSIHQKIQTEPTKGIVRID
jgi:hypothetical protein